MNKNDVCPDHGKKPSRQLGDGWVRCPGGEAAVEDRATGEVTTRHQPCKFTRGGR